MLVGAFSEPIWGLWGKNMETKLGVATYQLVHNWIAMSHTLDRMNWIGGLS